jgi:hypothetical protein
MATYFTAMGIVETHHSLYKGILLDRMEIKGKRGGITLAWRRTDFYNYSIYWSDTREEALLGGT